MSARRSSKQRSLAELLQSSSNERKKIGKKIESSFPSNTRNKNHGSKKSRIFYVCSMHTDSAVMSLVHMRPYHPFIWQSESFLFLGLFILKKMSWRMRTASTSSSWRGIASLRRRGSGTVAGSGSGGGSGEGSGFGNGRHGLLLLLPWGAGCGTCLPCVVGTGTWIGTWSVPRACDRTLLLPLAASGLLRPCAWEETSPSLLRIPRRPAAAWASPPAQALPRSRVRRSGRRACA